MQNRKEISNIKRVHFIGIGGIGMSALARMLVHRGVEVSGSDATESDLTKTLQGEGMSIVYEQIAENISSDMDMVVYTDAMRADAPELMRARELGIPTLSYFEALGEIAKAYKVIAVAGTHGKTTTTAMLAHSLIAGGLNPTVIVGSLVDWGEGVQSNFRAGGSEYLLVEACEYKRHFLNFNPYILAITNIELDHPDYYKDLADIESAFDELKAKSEMVIDADSAREYMPLVPELRVLGEYNRENAALALAVCDKLGVEQEKAQQALAQFSGTWRRFEYKGKTQKGAFVYDDYAHHPTAIRAALSGARAKFKDVKIIVAFESHTYSRTGELMDDFAESFTDADEVIITPIYPAREEPIEGVSGEVLAEKIAKNKNADVVHYVQDLSSAVAKADELAEQNDIIIFMGAGDLFKYTENIVRDKVCCL